MDKIRVLIVDDHALVRMGLIALLGTEPDVDVVGEAEDGAAAVRKALRLRPDVVVMDIMMPGTDGITATRELKERLPGVRVLILTTSTASDDIARALEAGASGAITKSTANAKLIIALKAVAAGRRYLAPEIEELMTADPPVQKLTNRQTEILRSVTRGLTNADIALQLGIGAESVKDHLNAIFAKIGAANRSEAVAIALRKHLV